LPNKLPEFPKIALPETFTTRLANIKNFFTELPNKLPEFPKIALPETFTTRLANIKNFFTELPNKLPEFPKIALPEDFTTKISKVKDFFVPIFDFVGNASKTIGDAVLGSGKLLSDAFTAVKGFFVPIFDFVGNASKTIGNAVLGAGKLLSDAFTAVKGFITPVFNFLDGILPIIKPLIRLGTLFARFTPLGLIFALVDFFTGFYEGFTEEIVTIDEDGNEIVEQRSLLEKTMNGVKEGLFEMFRGFITFPLDIIKDGLSWILEKLGLEIAADALDSFSFTGVFNKLVEGEFDIIGSLKNFAKMIYNPETGSILGFKIPSIADLKLPEFPDIGEKISGFVDELGKFFADLIPSKDDLLGMAFAAITGDDGKINGVTETALALTIPGYSEEEIETIAQAYLKREAGGPIQAGQPYLVGEAGPELIIPNASGKVIPNDALQTTLARNGEAIYQGSNEVSNLMNGGTTIIAPTNVSDNSVKNTTTTTMSGSSNVRTTDDSVRAFNSNPYM
jgi:hypothetical protein